MRTATRELYDTHAAWQTLELPHALPSYQQLPHKVEPVVVQAAIVQAATPGSQRDQYFTIFQLV